MRNRSCRMSGGPKTSDHPWSSDPIEVKGRCPYNDAEEGSDTPCNRQPEAGVESSQGKLLPLRPDNLFLHYLLNTRNNV